MTLETRKTYSHLEAARRIPTEYEIATSKLLYYTGRGFEVDVPLKEWFSRYQSHSPLVSSDWDAFVDPRQTTYTKYVGIQRAKEQYVETLFRSIEEGGFDRTLEGEWVEKLERYWSPFRFAGHGLQMIAGYVGSMAPSGRITIVCALQTADETAGRSPSRVSPDRAPRSSWSCPRSPSSRPPRFSRRTGSHDGGVLGARRGRR